MAACGGSSAGSAGLVGIAALARLLAAAHGARSRPRAGTGRRIRAEALRPKLAETPRAAGTRGRRPGRARPPPVPPTESLEERRARVHAKAQEAIDAMEAPEEQPRVSEHASAEPTSPATLARLEEQVRSSTGEVRRLGVAGPLPARTTADERPAPGAATPGSARSTRRRAGGRSCRGSCSRPLPRRRSRGRRDRRPRPGRDRAASWSAPGCSSR